MKIEHIAIWADDLDAFCDFYARYFGATVGAKYHNPTRGFTSCFLTFGGAGGGCDGCDGCGEDRNGVSGDAGCCSGCAGDKGCGARIEAMQIPGLEAPASRGNMLGLTHFAISVGSPGVVDALTERLRADGHTIVGEPRTTGDGYYESVVLDPEGNHVEIVA